MKEKLRWAETKLENQLENFQEIVWETIANIETGGISIGEGKTAKVLILEKFPCVCLKKITERGVSKNRSYKEMEFLDIMCKHNFSVPIPICSLEAKDADYMFMETIKGMSIESLIEEDKIEELPENFDFKNFFAELREMVVKMHEIRIFHRDLHRGNIMIDKEGKPAIIDFGDATINYISSEDPYRDINPKGELIIYNTDEDSINETYRQFGKYLREKGFFQKSN